MILTNTCRKRCTVRFITRREMRIVPKNEEIGTEGLVMLLLAEFKHYSDIYGKRIAKQSVKEAYTKVFREGKSDGQ